MKITKSVLKHVQHDIDTYGLEVAVFNILWTNAVEQLTDLGINEVVADCPPSIFDRRVNAK